MLTARTVGFLVNPTAAAVEISGVETAARVLGVDLMTLKASTPNEIDSAFAILVARRIGALLVVGDPLFSAQSRQLAALAARHAVPASYADRDNVVAGGLMSYGENFSVAWHLAGTYAGQILKGERPADLPVQQATKVGLVLNMKTAKALGITIPPNLLAIADEVIE